MTKLDELLNNYRCAGIDAYQCGGDFGTAEALAAAEQAIRGHVEGAMMAGMMFGKETERDAPYYVTPLLKWQKARQDAWGKLIAEWVGE